MVRSRPAVHIRIPGVLPTRLARDNQDTLVPHHKPGCDEPSRDRMGRYAAQEQSGKCLRDRLAQRTEYRERELCKDQAHIAVARGHPPLQSIQNSLPTYSAPKRKLRL